MLINENNTAYESHIQNSKNEQTFQVFESIENIVLYAIKVSKQQYHSRISKNLMDPGYKLKNYWSLLKTFLINKKIP